MFMKSVYYPEKFIKTNYTNEYSEKYDLIVGKIYEIKWNSIYFFSLIDERGKDVIVSKSRFISIDEYRRIQIEQIISSI